MKVSFIVKKRIAQLLKADVSVALDELFKYFNSDPDDR